MLFSNFPWLHAIYLALAFSGVSRAASISSKRLPALTELDMLDSSEQKFPEPHRHAASSPASSELKLLNFGGEKFTEPQPHAASSFWKKVIQKGRCPSTKDIAKHGVSRSFEHRSVLVLSTTAEPIVGREAQAYATLQGLVFVTLSDVFPNLHSEFRQDLEPICSGDLSYVLFKAMLRVINARHLFIYNPEEREVSAAVRRFQEIPGERPGRTSIYSVTLDRKYGYHIRPRLEDTSTWKKYITKNYCPPFEDLIDISAIGDRWMKSVILTTADHPADYQLSNDKGSPVITIREAFPGYSLVAKEMERICGRDMYGERSAMKFRLLKAIVWSMKAEEIYVYNDPELGPKKIWHDMVVKRFQGLGGEVCDEGQVQVTGQNSGREYTRVRYHE